MNRTDLEKFFKETQEKADPCKVTYYSNASKCTFFVRRLDENGKPIPKRHPITGAILMQKNRVIYEEISETFTAIVPTRSAKADALCFKVVESDKHGVFTPYQKEMIAVLESMADGGDDVKRESDYKRGVNPEAWQREQELNALKKEHNSKVEKAYEAGKAESASEIEKLRNALAAAEREMDNLTDPKDKQHQAGGKK